MHYAHPLARLAAFFIDFVLYGIAVRIINTLFISFTRPTAADLESISAFLWLNMGLVACVMLAYFTLFEGLLMRATPGKLLLKLRVANTSGAPTAFSPRIARSLFKMLPFLLMMVLGVSIKTLQYNGLYGVPSGSMPMIKAAGSLLVVVLAAVSYGLVFTHASRRALHDRIAGTVVIKA